jgi:hypothetical protein
MNPNAKPITDAYAMAFFNRSREYQSAADQLAAPGSSCASDPINQLYFHAEELTLKAYLRANGLAILGTNRQSHELVKLYEECRSLGLTIDPTDRLDVENIVNLLGAANEDHGFRYFNLKIGGLDSRLMRPRHAQRQTACDDQHRYPCDSCLFHVDPLLSLNT